MDTVHLLVEPGKALPQVGRLLPVDSVLTGRKYTLKVKRIDSILWAKNVPGALLIAVSGTKELKGADDGPEAAGNQ